MRVLIAGFGPLGVALGAELRRSHLTRDELTIIDPNSKPLAVFERRIAQSDTTYLRSGPRDQIDPSEEDGLEQYANVVQRQGEFLPPRNRPSSALFIDHGRFVADSYELRRSHLPEKLLSFSITGKGQILVKTSRSQIDCKHLCLCLGQQQLNTPQPTRLRDSRVIHMFDPEFDSDTTPLGENIGIIGGGWSSVVLALKLAVKQGKRVTIISRSPIENRSSPIASDDWYDPAKRRELIDLPWEERWQLLRSFRSSTIPFFEMNQLQEAISKEQIRTAISSVRTFDLTRKSLRLELEEGTCDDLDQIIFATGLSRGLDRSIIDSAIRANLPLDSKNRPVLSNDLEWGEGSGVYISGSDAAPVVGPFADRISGGKIAAKIISGSLFNR